MSAANVVPSVIIICIVVGVLAFTVLKSRQVSAKAAADARRREAALVATLSGNPAPEVAALAASVPTLEDLTLPGVLPVPRVAEPAPVRPAPSTVEAAAVVLGGAAARVRDAGAAGGDRAAAQELRAVLADPAVLALLVVSDGPATP